MKTLVIGLPGTGKSTYCRNHLGTDGLCYDLDAIAAAFRLRGSHEEEHPGARALANEMLFAFGSYAREHTPNIYIIRTAPTIDQFKRIAPDRVVICRHKYARRSIVGEGDLVKKISMIEQHCLRYGIPTEDA